MPQEKRSLSWIILHLAVILLTLLSLLTGLRIAAVSRPEILHISVFLPQGYLHSIHLVSAAGLIAVIATYLFLHRYEKTRRFKFGHFHHRVTQFGYCVVVSLLITGTLLYFGSPIKSQDLHYYSALAFILYFFLHALVMFVQYGWMIFPRILSAAKGKFSDSKIIGAGLVLFVLLIVLFQPYTDKTLHATQIEINEIIEIDGIADEAVWQHAKPITIHTHGGANFNGGTTPVTLRAVHNGVEAFFHISWLDETKSLKHLPLIKTENGWRVIEDGFYRFNELTNYEDKFAVMLANSCESGASKTARLGPKPLKDRPANWHGKGYHYADDGQIRDIWHWKAIRTNDMFLADDNFFGSPDIVRHGQRRYTAGYLTDGKESGAYVMNWQWYNPKGVLPKRLPQDPDDIKRYLNGEPTEWVVPWYDFSLYEADKDTFPPGTLMPSVLHLSNRFEGDRAHVRARGEWQDGRWSLELVRPLDTKSANDVVMQTGTCLWVSAFDHSQIAHTRHVRPVRLQLEGL